MDGDRLIVIGRITRPHGLRGEVRVVPATDNPERFQGLSECVLWDASRGERETRRITTARRHGDVMLVTFAGHETVEAADRLRGRLVAVPEAEVLPPPPGHFYPWRLEGARVVTEDGHEIGRFAGVQSGGGHDLWIVRTDTPAHREHLIPAVPEIVLDVDVTAGRVVIRPPDGLLDL